MIQIKRRRVFLLTLVVAFFYIFFTTPPTLHVPLFRFSTQLNASASNYYQLLSEAFIHGQLSLPILPSQKLLALPNPYDPVQNAGLTLHDASLYHGKYYLYFGPLPAILFFIPIKLITHYYPSETLSVFFFLLFGYIILLLLLLKIKERYFAEVSEIQFLLSGLLLALGTTAPFLLTRALFYESTIACAFFIVSLAILFLYYAIITHFTKCKYVFLFSLFLALSVSARPNFSLVCIALTIILFFYFFNQKKSRRISLSIALFFPPLIIAIVLGLYNYYRFDSVFDFGSKYQLAGTNMHHFSLLPHMMWYSIREKIYYYFLQSFQFSHHYRHFKEIPHVLLKQTWLPKGQAYYYEPVAGVLMTSPVLFFLFAQRIALKSYLKNATELQYELALFLRLITLIPCVIILFFLVSFVHPTQRYEMDFTPYLIIMAIIDFWLIQQSQLKSGSRLLIPIRIAFYALALISILIGFNIGVTGYGV